jgi:hypothetical protein
MPEAAFEAVEPTDVADTAVRREESSRVLEPDLLAADMLLDKDSTGLGKRRGRRLKACSSPGALSAPSPEGAPRGVLGTPAEGKV